MANTDGGFTRNIELEKRYTKTRTTRENYPLRAGKIRASEVLDCIVKNRRHFEAIPPTDVHEADPQLVLKLEEGNLHEEHVIEVLMASGYEVTDQQEWVSLEHDGVKILGKIDLMIDGRNVKDPKTKGVMDVKTVGNFEGQNLPKYRDMKQVRLYAVAMGLQTGYLFYKERMEGKVMAFTIHVPQEFRVQVEDHLEAIAAVESHEDLTPQWLPECSKCRYRTMCWGDGFDGRQETAHQKDH